MDYACDRGVNRETYATNVQRMGATHMHEILCREANPPWPWLLVLQGDTLEERAYDLTRHRSHDLLPRDHAGIGSVCECEAAAARQAIRFYRAHLPVFMWLIPVCLGEGV
jgi:hypothetical protein